MAKIGASALTHNKEPELPFLDQRLIGFRVFLQLKLAAHTSLIILHEKYRFLILESLWLTPAEKLTLRTRLVLSVAEMNGRPKEKGRLVCSRPVWKRFLQTNFGDLRFLSWPIRAIAP